MSLVLDASLTLAWFFDDERSAQADAVLDIVAARGAIVPALWKLEVANALLAAVRRRRIDRAYLAAALEQLAMLPVAIDAESHRHSWTASLALAEAHGLTLYDATYLELAQRQRLPLASLDRALREAAGSLGQPLLGA